MRTIVVDDEPWMLKRFAIECEGIPDVQLLGSFKSPVQALAFAKENLVELAFLDMEMPEMNGLQLAGKLRELYPEVIVIFVSAYESYMAEAFKSKSADYYIMKPYDTGDVEAAIDRARLLSGRLRKKVAARTFGPFEVFVENAPVPFPDADTKALMALLIDRRGSALSPEDACRALWPDLPADKNAPIQFRRTLRRLQETLKAARLDGIVDQSGQGAFIHAEVMDCDLFQYLDGDLKTMRQFSGEYMTGYAWAERSRQELIRQNETLSRYSDSQTRNTLCASIHCLTDASMTLTYMNEGFLAVTGYTREEIAQHFHNSLRSLILRDDFDRARARGRELMQTGAALELEFRIVSKSGDEIWVLGKCEQPKPVADGEFELSCILIDISGIKSEQNNLEQMAQHDSLTGLLNRGAAQEKVRRYLSLPGSSPAGALILMDVDNFKAVNDTYGHPFADTVLTDIAAILSRSFRASDILCRLGGDEMMVFLKGVDSASAREKLQSAIDALKTRLSSKTERGELSCSFGGVLCPEDGSDFDTLYQRADLALYAAKEKKNCTVWFSDVRMRVADQLAVREITAIDSCDSNKTIPFSDLWGSLPDNDDLPGAILAALTNIGRQYGISRAYVYEMASDQPMAVNTFEWCASHAQPELGNHTAIPKDAVSPYYELMLRNDGLLYCYDICTLSEPLYAILAPQGIKSVLQCSLVHEGAFYGMVGFDECRERRYWSGRQIKLLHDFAGVLADALFAYRQKNGNSLAALQKSAVGTYGRADGN